MGEKDHYLDNTRQFGAETMLAMQHEPYSLKNWLLDITTNLHSCYGQLHVIPIWKNHVSNTDKLKAINWI